MHYRYEYEGERIPTLEEAVMLCKELDLLMFLELKSDRKEVRFNLIIKNHFLCSLW